MQSQLATPPLADRLPSAGRTLTIAALIMMGSVLLSRIMGLVREQVLAAFFGTGTAEIEAYTASFMIPEIVNHLCAGGFFSITFIPIFQRYLVQNREADGWRSFSNLLTAGTVVMLLLIAASLALAQPVLSAMIGNDPERLRLALGMTRIIIPAQLFFYWGALLMAVQYAQRQFFLPAMLPLAYNAGIIVLGVALYRLTGIYGFAWGVLAGSFVGNVLLQVPGALRGGMRFTPHINVRHPDVRRYLVLTVPLILGMGMSYANEIFFRLFGSMIDKGVTALCNYPLRIMLIIVAVFGQASGVASYPFLSKLATRGDVAEMNRLLHRILGKLVIILIPLCGIAMVVSHEIMMVLFQRGQFTALSSAQTAPLLMIYLTGALAFSCNAIIVRNFYALQNTMTPMIISTTAAAASLPAYWFFAREWGAAGIALAAALFMNVQTIVLYTIWYRGHPDPVNLKKIGTTALLSAVAAAPALGVCIVLRSVLLPLGATLPPLPGGLLILLGSALPAGLIAAAMLHVLGVQHFGELWSRVVKRRAGKPHAG